MDSEVLLPCSVEPPLGTTLSKNLSPAPFLIIRNLIHSYLHPDHSQGRRLSFSAVRDRLFDVFAATHWISVLYKTRCTEQE